jgi:hypothetical protein
MLDKLLDFLKIWRADISSENCDLAVLRTKKKLAQIGMVLFFSMACFSPMLYKGMSEITSVIMPLILFVYSCLLEMVISCKIEIKILKDKLEGIQIGDHEKQTQTLSAQQDGKI